MKTLKKSLSIILTIIMLLSCCSAVAFAYDSNHLPQIYIEGFESKQVFHKDDTEQKDPLFFPINVNKMLSSLTQYEKHLKKAIAEGNPDLLYTYLCLWMDDCFGLVALKPDGISNNDDVVVEETTLNYRGNGKYVFRHDCRLDPVDIAHQFNDYVKEVQAHSGSQKFELAASSFGASVALAYINEYPEARKDIDSLVLCVPSTNGVNFAGELFSGTFDIDPDALLAFIDKMEISDDLTLFLSVLNKTGTLDAILDAALEPILEAALIKTLRTVVHDIFGTMPSMWSFVDDRYFYKALEYTYGKDYTDAGHEYAGLIDRITYYHENIMMKADDIIETAISENINVSIIAKYGNAPIPVSKEGNFTGDGFVALEMASFGATCRMNGEKLPDGYTQAKHTELNMISPDGCVDASTSLLPYNTWYIKGLNHGQKSDGYYELINTILYDDMDITDPRYPQFLEVPEYDAEALAPMTEGEAPKEETSWLQDFLTLLPRLLRMLIEKLKEMFVK